MNTITAAAEISLALAELDHEQFETVYVPALVARTVGRAGMCGDIPRMVADRVYPGWWLFEVPEYGDETGEARADWGSWLLDSGWDMPEAWIISPEWWEIHPRLELEVWGWE